MLSGSRKTSASKSGSGPRLGSNGLCRLMLRICRSLIHAKCDHTLAIRRGNPARIRHWVFPLNRRAVLLRSTGSSLSATHWPTVSKAGQYSTPTSRFPRSSRTNWDLSISSIIRAMAVQEAACRSISNICFATLRVASGQKRTGLSSRSHCFEAVSFSMGSRTIGSVGLEARFLNSRDTCTIWLSTVGICAMLCRSPRILVGR